MFTSSFAWTSSPASVAITSFAFMFERRARAGLEDVDRELVVELARGDPVGRGRDPLGLVGVEQAELRVRTRARRALIRPSQRATWTGIGSPETGKFATAFAVSPPQSSPVVLRHLRRV